MFDLGWEDGFETTSPRAGCYLIVPDVERWHVTLTALGHPVTPLLDEPYGIWEFSVRDGTGIE
ncbi:MAG TPA: hypothetical protein VJM33_03175 [Microthrixaceae bacterium]|nr:hypothetical protein [Microthrixaceae bacterium]